MNILALDSALSSCSAAVIKDGEIISEIFEHRMRGQAERLVPMCQEVCAEVGLSFDMLDAIAVTRGPGTFTGVRIGLATAKGLALALDVKLVGVTTLEVVARNAAAKLGAAHEGRIAVAHDARRSEVYVQLFDLEKGLAVPVSEPAAVPLSDVEKLLGKQVTAVIGTGAELIKPLLSPDAMDQMDFPEMQVQPNSGTIGIIAWERLVQGGVPEAVIPLYLRAPDAIAARPVTYPFQNQ